MRLGGTVLSVTRPDARNRRFANRLIFAELNACFRLEPPWCLLSHRQPVQFYSADGLSLEFLQISCQDLLTQTANRCVLKVLTVLVAQ